MPNTILKSVALSVGLAFGSLTAASAATVDLAFIMDESGSIDQNDYLNAMDALADALDASIPTNDPNNQYSITVVSFSSGASVDVGPTLIEDAGDLATVTSAIRNATYSGGGTNYANAFQELLDTVTVFGDNSIINMMTDGEATDNGFDERDALRAAGWDALSFEAIDGFSPPDSTTLASLAFDVNGVGGASIISDANDITNPLTNSFVLEVAGFGEAYANAIDKKVQRVVNPNVIPLPAGFPLILTGLGALGLIRLRKGKKTA